MSRCPDNKRSAGKRRGIPTPHERGIALERSWGPRNMKPRSSETPVTVTVTTTKGTKTVRSVFPFTAFRNADAVPLAEFLISQDGYDKIKIRVRGVIGGVDYDDEVIVRSDTAPYAKLPGTGDIYQSRGKLMYLLNYCTQSDPVIVVPFYQER